MAAAEQRRLADTALLGEWRQLHAAASSASPPPARALAKVLRQISTRFESTDSSRTVYDLEDLSVFLTSRSMAAMLLQSLQLKQPQSTGSLFTIIERLFSLEVGTRQVPCCGWRPISPLPLPPSSPSPSS